MMEWKKVIDIKENADNPKKIDYYKLEQLKKSIKEFPEMLELRPIVVNGNGIIIGGNMRFRAAKELGLQEVPVLILDNPEKEFEFLIKDNLSYGEWNWEGLKIDFSSGSLLDWGLDVPIFFRDEEIDYTKIESDDFDLTDKKKSKDMPQSTKKAMYLFYTQTQKEELLKGLKAIEGSTNEEKILQKIKNLIND